MDLGNKIAAYFTNPPFSTNGPNVIEHGGRFYINMGRPGFNTRANNANGYATRAQAQRVLHKHEVAGERAEHARRAARETLARRWYEYHRQALGVFDSVLMTARSINATPREVCALIVLDLPSVKAWLDTLPE